MNDIYDTPYSREWLPLVKKILEKEGITEIIYVTSSVSFWDSLQVLFVKDGKEFCRTIKEKEVAAQNQATQQGALADLPAADIASVAYENALLVSNEFNFVCPGNYCIESFKAFCQKRLTELAGR
jgi:hypothetical protein